MAVELNLLPDKKIPLTPEVEARGRGLMKFSIIVLFITVVLAAAIFAGQQALLTQKHSLQEKIANLETVITGYKDREILLVLLKQKLNGIKAILTVRPDLAKEMELFAGFLPPEAEIVGLEGDKTGMFTLKISCRNLFGQ
jgi:hypothetical protein